MKNISMLLIFLLSIAISACSKNSNTETIADLTPDGVVGYIESKSEVARLEKLAFANNEEAMNKLYLHYDFTGDKEKKLKLCEKGASLGYKRMLICLGLIYASADENENCKKIIEIFYKLEALSKNDREIKRYFNALGLIRTDSGIECRGAMGNR